MRRLLAATLIVLVFAGCGGRGSETLSHAQYQRHVERSLADLNRRILALRANASALLRLRAALDDTADELDGLGPPSDAEKPNGELVHGLRAFAATVDDETQAILHAHGLEAREALARVARSDGVREIQRAERDLRRAGYRLPP